MSQASPALDEHKWKVRVFRKTLSSWQRMIPRNSQGGPGSVHASPRKRCIVLHGIQVRIRLSPTKNIEGFTAMYRRGDRLLITSCQPPRSYVMHFDSVKDCLAFSDQFAKLNVGVELDGMESDASDSPKMLIHAYEKTTENVDAAAKRKEQDEVVSYAGRLLNDSHFAAFVKNFERCLSSSVDGRYLLAALDKDTRIASDESTSGGMG